MLYFVECGFNNSVHEQAWNDFYSHEKLPALISVQGFASSQRFHILRGNNPPYLAIHDIANPEVLNSTEYREKGGGNFARWQSWISDWHRNVYSGGQAPLLMQHECLLLCQDAAIAQRYGLQRIQAIALDKNPTERWMGKLPAEQAADIGDMAISIYQSMGNALIARMA